MGTSNDKRASRPLGRGLEEISHLFLSNHSSSTAGAHMRDPPSDKNAVRPVTRVGVAVLRAAGPLTKGQVAAALRECRSVLADDMLAIGPGIVCSPYGEIDLLALDRSHQLTIIDLQTTLDDGMVARGLGHVDWAVRNLRTVQRVYPGWTIDASRQPRLVLVAPRFSIALRSGIRQITTPGISCFRYCVVELANETGILVERL